MSAVGAVRRRLTAALAPALIDKVERDHTQPDSQFRRRRVVAGLVLVVGGVLLGVSLAVEPGDPTFYPLTLLVAATWVVGGLASGPLHLGHIPSRGALRRPVVTPIVLGLLAGAVFVAGALVVRQVPPLAGYVDEVLAHADEGYLPLIAFVTLVNGVAEEIFFRGALYAAIGVDRPVITSTAVYGLATAATRNPALLLGSLIMGALFGMQRRVTGGIQASVLTHVTWSALMLRFLPPLFADRPDMHDLRPAAA